MKKFKQVVFLSRATLITLVSSAVRLFVSCPE